VRASYGEGAPLQRGLPGVAQEEARLPSEAVLSGEILNDRQREAYAGMLDALGERPEGFEVEEWRVVMAVLSPPSDAGHVGGDKARAALAIRARECFPGFPVHAALKAFREVQARAHVAELIANFRALEGIDVMEQRAMLREYYRIGLTVMESVRPAKGEKFAAWVLDDPAGAAKIVAAGVAAGKALEALDALRAPAQRPLVFSQPDEAGDTNSGNGKAAIDATAELAAKIARVGEDLRDRALSPGG